MFNITAYNTDLFLLGIAVIANLILGAVVFFEDTKSFTNRLLFLFTIVASSWSVVNYVSYQVLNHQAALFWVRSVMFFAVWFGITFFFLMYVFPDKEFKFPRKIFYGIVGFELFTMILTQSRFVFSDVILSAGSAPQPVFDWGIMFFFFGAVVPIILGMFLLGRKVYTNSGEARKSSLYLLIGVLIMFVSIITFNFIFPISFNNSSYVKFGALFTLPFVVITTYAILRHHLLNIRIITTEMLVFFMLAVMTLDVLTAHNGIETFTRVLILALLLVFSVLLIKSVLREVKQREQLEKLSKELELVNEQLKAIDQAKTEFLSVASHQLRTPLTAIKGYVSMLLSGDFGQVTPVQKETLGTIFESSERLVRLISDLLDLSRIESGRMEFDFAPVDLCKMIESIIEELAQKAKDKGLYLFFDQVNRSCPLIKADEEKMRQALINLIDNAVKYTVHGGVTVRLIQANGKLRFSVTDTGIGVDPKEKTRLFEKFFRSEAAIATTREGTGLGIYVVKKIIEAHGGQIWFDSPGVNKGTTFYVDLPIPDGPIKEERIKISSLEAF